MAAAGVALGTVLGCVGPNGVNFTGSGNGGNGNGGSAGTGTTTIGNDSGLPCDVATFLTTNCTSCHGDPVSGGAPMSLLSYAQLTAPSKADAAKSNAQLSVERMEKASAPMPPGGLLADISVFKSWVAGGALMGACGEADAGPPDPTFLGDPTCPSGNTAPHQDEPPENVPDSVKAQMNPGEACVKCHDGDPAFKFAGTVFPTGKILDRCLPPATIDLTQAQVVVTDKNGVDHTFQVDKVGNFHSPNYPTIAVPYKARVVYQGKERVMSAAQTSGDCNGCHTATGTMNAPGRIALPQ